MPTAEKRRRYCAVFVPEKRLILDVGGGKILENQAKMAVLRLKIREIRVKTLHYSESDVIIASYNG